MMDWQNRSVLITGGAGFIGSHLAEKLVSMDARVTVIDNMAENNAINLHAIKNKIKFINCDLSDIHAVSKLDQKWDFIFHLAALANPKDCEDMPELAFKINSQATFNLLNFAVRNDIEKIVFTSSAQLYGKHPNYLPIDENHPTNSRENIYNLTKQIAENLCVHFSENYGVPILFLRLFNTYGPKQSKDYFIPTVILQALNSNVIEIWNEKPTRDFIYVEDTVKALIKSAEAKYTGGPINVGSGKEVNVGEIARQIATELDVDVKVLNKDVTGSMRMQCDNLKARRILGWKPEISFEKSLKITIDWYKENRHLFI